MGDAGTEDPVSMHPYSPASLEIIDAHQEGWVLDLGAGGKLVRMENVIQVDIFRYPMTDVVATADCLPFRDNAFRAVVSQAVFEHLQYPEQAASEVRRVLQPGGIAKIDTAFLQPEHGYPHHFFNATETGLRHWFREFDIERSGVEDYQHPKWSLSWFLGVYLDRLPPEQALVLRNTPIGGVLCALERMAGGQARECDQSILQALDGLPPHELRTLAAGVSIWGRNPPKVEAINALSSDELLPSGGAEDARRFMAAKQELDVLRARLEASEEARVLALDRGNYLAQYYPDFTSIQRIGLRAWLQFRIAAFLRAFLPRSAWFALYSLVKSRHKPVSAMQPAMAPPFVTVIVDPQSVTSVINAFFSLTHQTYSGWELLLIEHSGQLASVRRAMRDFVRLDQRVRTLYCATQNATQRLLHAQKGAGGRYLINLPEGGVVVREGVQTIFSLSQARPQSQALVADYERVAHDGAEPMRCHCKPTEGEAMPAFDHYGFVAHSLNKKPYGPPAGDSGSVTYFPGVLFRQILAPDVGQSG
jgi:SAM-dependent methyltransferase